MKIDDLKREAASAASWRGHTLGEWEDSHHGSARDIANGLGKTTSIATCACGAFVQVDPRPQPNGIDIGGSAVAVNCPAAE